MDKPKSEPIFDYHQVARYLKITHGIKEMLLREYIVRTHSNTQQNSMITIYEGHTDPEAYNIKPKEIGPIKTLLKEFGSKDNYGTFRVNLKFWW